LDLAARLRRRTAVRMPVFKPTPLLCLQIKLHWHTALVTTFLCQVDVVPRKYISS
jgi:hypothetical protein